MRKIAVFALTVFVLLMSTGLRPEVVAAAAPNITAAHWNMNSNCADQVYASESLETYTAKTLAGEWYDFMPKDSLRTGSVIIRANGLYKVHHPDNGTNCVGVTGSWDVNTQEQSYLYDATATAYPNTFTESNYVQSRGVQPEQWYYYSNCTQDLSSTLADQGWAYTPIVTDPSQGVFTSSQVTWCKQNYASGQDLLQPYSGLSVGILY